MNDRVFHSKMDKAENKVRQACLCSNVMAADKSIKAQARLPDLDDTDARSLNTRPLVRSNQQRKHPPDEPTGAELGICQKLFS